MIRTAFRQTARAFDKAAQALDRTVRIARWTGRAFRGTANATITALAVLWWINDDTQKQRPLPSGPSSGFDRASRELCERRPREETAAYIRNRFFKILYPKNKFNRYEHFDQKILEPICAISGRFGRDALHALAVILQESGGRRRICNPKSSACGPLQYITSTYILAIRRNAANLGRDFPEFAQGARDLLNAVGGMDDARRKFWRMRGIFRTKKDALAKLEKKHASALKAVAGAEAAVKKAQAEAKSARKKKKEAEVKKAEAELKEKQTAYDNLKSRHKTALDAIAAARQDKKGAEAAKNVAHRHFRNLLFHFRQDIREKPRLTTWMQIYDALKKGNIDYITHFAGPRGGKDLRALALSEKRAGIALPANGPLPKGWYLNRKKKYATPPKKKRKFFPAMRRDWRGQSRANPSIFKARTTLTIKPKNGNGKPRTVAVSVPRSASQVIKRLNAPIDRAHQGMRGYFLSSTAVRHDPKPGAAPSAAPGPG